VHLLILVFSILLAGIAYMLGMRAPNDKWELLQKIPNGQSGLYKRRKHVKFGKFERSYATYAVLRNIPSTRVWNFVWRIDRIGRGGRVVGLDKTIDSAGQTNLYELGFAPPLGLYAVYTGEEDNLSYPEREEYVMELYKKTVGRHKGWREDPAFSIRNALSRWRLGLIVFCIASVLGIAVMPVEVESSQVMGWTLIGMMALSLAVTIFCVLKTQGAMMWVQASGGALLVACIMSLVSLPSVILGTNALSFTTLCEGSVPVERSWTEGSGDNVVHYADVTLPTLCRFDAHKTEISSVLYHEFQTGRRVVDVVVSEGLLGYKRIKLIGS
jgi:hypothetical protein